MPKKIKHSFSLNLLVVIVSFFVGFYLIKVDTFLDGYTAQGTTPPQVGLGLFSVIFLMTLLMFFIDSIKPKPTFGSDTNLKFMLTGSLAILSLGLAWTIKTLIQHNPLTIELFPVAFALGIMCGLFVLPKLRNRN